MKKLLTPVMILMIMATISCSKTDIKQPVTSSTTKNDNSISATVKTGILTGSRTGFYLLNAANGSTIWNYRPGGVVTNAFCSSTACVYGSNVLFNLGDTLYSAAVRTGVIQWAVYFKHFRSAICIANGKAYISTPTGINCVNPNNGALIWKMPYGSFNPRNQNSSPTVANGIVYVGGATDNILYALNASTGALIWKYQVTTANLALRAPTFENGIVYMQGYDTLYAFDGSTGAIQWQKYIPTNNNINSGPSVMNGKLYVPSDSLYCLNAGNGSRLWAFRDTTIRNADCYGDVFVTGNVVYAAFFDVFYKLDANTGSVYPGWGNMLVSPATDFVVTSNNLLVIPGNDPANLVANKATTDAPVWSIPFNDRNSNDWCAPISINSSGDVVYPTISGMRP